MPAQLLLRHVPHQSLYKLRIYSVFVLTLITTLHCTLQVNSVRIKSGPQQHSSNVTSLNDLEWPLTQISRSRYIIQRQITRKWYKIELYLQWWTNRKSHYGLSNGAIFNDLERPLSWFSRSRHSLTLNISQTATDTATVTIEGYIRKPYSSNRFQIRQVKCAKPENSEAV